MHRSKQCKILSKYLDKNLDQLTDLGIDQSKARSDLSTPTRIQISWLAWELIRARQDPI